MSRTPKAKVLLKSALWPNGATLALGAGVQPKIVSENLGHSSTRITMDVYSHALPAMTADAVTRVAHAIYGLDV